MRRTIHGRASAHCRSYAVYSDGDEGAKMETRKYRGEGLMIFFLETEDGEIEHATCGGSVATSEYVKVVDTGNGLDIFIDNELRCQLNYAEIARVEACLKMLDAASPKGDSLLGCFKIYKGEKI